MASNLIASSGAKLAAVIPRLRSLTPTAGYVFPVAGQAGGASLPLRWSAATRVSPLPRRAKTGDAQEGSDKERDAYEVHTFLSYCAQQSIGLLSTISPPEDDAAAALKGHFSQLIAAADSEGDGELERSAALRGLIAGVHRLIELAYKSYGCPRVSARTTEEVFVDYFISVGYTVSKPSFDAEYTYNKNLAQFPEADRRYLGSMITLMNLATAVVHGLRAKPYMILDMFPLLDEEDLKGLSDSPFPKPFTWSGI